MTTTPTAIIVVAMGMIVVMIAIPPVIMANAQAALLHASPTLILIPEDPVVGAQDP